MKFTFMLDSDYEVSQAETAKWLGQMKAHMNALLDQLSQPSQQVSSLAQDKQEKKPQSPSQQSPPQLVLPPAQSQNNSLPAYKANSLKGAEK